VEWELLHKSGEPYKYDYDGPVNKIQKVSVPKFMKRVIREESGTSAADSESMNSRQSSVG
jgi:hypothetical protein